MNKKIEYIVVVSMVLVGTYLVYHQIVNAQQQGDIVDQGDVRQFLELGEQKYREECYKDISDNVIFDDIMNDILDYMPDSIREDMCEKKISEIKNQTLGSILEK
jgi:hypothetical protein